MPLPTDYAGTDSQNGHPAEHNDRNTLINALEVDVTDLNAHDKQGAAAWDFLATPFPPDLSPSIIGSGGGIAFLSDAEIVYQIRHGELFYAVNGTTALQTLTGALFFQHQHDWAGGIPAVAPDSPIGYYRHAGDRTWTGLVVYRNATSWQLNAPDGSPWDGGPPGTGAFSVVVRFPVDAPDFP